MEKSFAVGVVVVAVNSRSDDDGGAVNGTH